MGPLELSSNAGGLGTAIVNVIPNTLNNSTFQINGTLGTITNAINLDSTNAIATILSSGTNTLSTGGMTLIGANNVINSSGTLNIGSSDIIADGTSAGSLIVNGSGILNIASANTYTGSTTLNSGTLQTSNNNAFSTGALTLNGGNLQALATVALANSSFNVGANDTAAIIGSHNITMPTGTLNSGSTLNDTNSATTTFTGLSSSGALNTTGGTIVMGGDNSGLSGNMTIGGSALEINNTNTDPLGTGSLALNGNTTLSSLVAASPVVNAFTIGGNTSIAGTNNITLSGSGILNTGSSLGININNSGTPGTATLSGTVIGAGAINVNDILALTGNNIGNSVATSLSGLITINNGATVMISNAANNNIALATPTGSLGISPVTINGGGILDLNNVGIANPSYTTNVSTPSTPATTVILLNGAGTSTSNEAQITTEGNTTIDRPIASGANSTPGTTGFPDMINVNTGTFTLNNGINAITANTGNIVVNATAGGTTFIDNSDNGTINALQTLVYNGNYQLNGTTNITSLYQIYTGTMLLGNDVQFITGPNSFVEVDATINSNPAIPGANTPLTIDTGTFTLNNAVGSAQPITSLDVNANTIALNNGNINTTSDQTYTGTVQLGNPSSALTSNTGSVIFNTPVTTAPANPTPNLSIDASSGNIQLSDVGTTTTPLGTVTLTPGNTATTSASLDGQVNVTNLAVTGGGITNINSGNISTAGSQTYSGTYQFRQHGDINCRRYCVWQHTRW